MRVKPFVVLRPTTKCFATNLCIVGPTPTILTGNWQKFSPQNVMFSPSKVSSYFCIMYRGIKSKLSLATCWSLSPTACTNSDGVSRFEGISFNSRAKFCADAVTRPRFHSTSESAVGLERNETCCTCIHAMKYSTWHSIYIHVYK